MTTRASHKWTSRISSMPCLSWRTHGEAQKMIITLKNQMISELCLDHRNTALSCLVAPQALAARP